MKRTRDNVYPGSQFKRPFGSSRGEYFGQSQVTGTGAMEGGCGAVGGCSASQKLTTNDVLTYLKEVKDMFQDQTEKYDMVIEVTKDFKAQRTDTTGVIARVKELFKGHNKLILGLKPKGFEIFPDEDETPTKKNVEFEEAISFVNKIKKRFQNDEHVYKSFLDILNKYRKRHKDINVAYSEVANLFGDHPDLLEEFTKFSNSLHAQLSLRQEFISASTRSSSTTPTLRQMQMDKQRARRDRIINAHAEHDINVDSPDVNGDKAMTKVQKDQRKRFKKDNRDRRKREVDDRESEHDTRRDFNSQCFPYKRKSARKVENYGMTSLSEDRDALKSERSHGRILWVFGAPREYGHGQPQGGTEGDAGGRASRRLTVDDAMSHLGEVKDAFKDQREKYEQFLEILKDFKIQRIDAGRVMARAKELFTAYDRLTHGFNTFLPEGCRIAPDGPRKLVIEEAISFVIKVKECFWSEENVYLSFLDALNSYRRGINPISAVYNEPDLFEEFKRFLPESFQDQEELSSITTLTSHGSQMDKTRDRIADPQAEDEVTVDRLDLHSNEEIMKVHKGRMKPFEGHVLSKISAIYSVLAGLVSLVALWIYSGN